MTTVVFEAMLFVFCVSSTAALVAFVANICKE